MPMPGSGSLNEGFREGIFFAPPKDASGAVIQPVVLNSERILGKHPYVLSEEIQANPDKYTVEQLEQIKAELKAIVEGHPSTTPEDREAARQITKTIQDIIDARPKTLPTSEKGTGTHRDFFIKVMGISPEIYERMKAKERVAALFDFLEIQVLEAKSGDKIYLGKGFSFFTMEIEIEKGLTTTFFKVAQSLQSIDAEHSELAGAFIGDMVAINKMLGGCAAMEDIQDSVDALETHLSTPSTKMNTSDWMRTPKFGKEYAGSDAFRYKFLRGQQLFDYLCSPEYMDVETEKGQVIRGFAVRSKYTGPQTSPDFILARYAVRRALSQHYDKKAELDAAFALPDVERRRVEVKKILERDIEARKTSGEWNKLPTGTDLDPKDRIDITFTESVCINHAEFTGLLASWDAGRIDTAHRGPHGLPIVANLEGSAATLKTGMLENTAAYRKKLKTEGSGRGVPGSNYSLELITRTLLPDHEYLYLKNGKSLLGMTVRGAFRQAKDVDELESWFDTSLEFRQGKGADVDTAAACKEAFIFYKYYTEGIGVDFKDLKKPVPFSEGFELEFDVGVAEKLMGISSHVEYWIWRDNVVHLARIDQKFKDFEEWRRFKAFENEYAASTNRAAVIVKYGADGNRYKEIFKQIHFFPSPEYRLIEGWSKGNPAEEGFKYFTRSAERAFTRIFAIDQKAAQEGRYGYFLQELFSQPHADWLNLMKKLVLGTLIIGQIELKRSNLGMDSDDVDAFYQMLSYDIWKHETERLIVFINKTLNQIDGEKEYSGIGIFTAKEIKMMLKDANVPDTLLRRVDTFVKRVQQKSN